MESEDIRRGFLNYFKTQSHTIVPSSPVTPHDDPTLLFTNAGMNQFKDVFLGKSKREYTRAATTQKCIRAGGKHNDLENVGHTSRHLTFFEMLGNFSFGDYFKKEAIGFAWDVVNHVFGFDPSKIWVTIYKDDDEAFEIWQKHVSKDRIVRFGEKDNFWAMGDTGPCGPCSELLYDRGEKFSKAKSPVEDLSGERFLEFWNLVFMQYNREGGEQKTLPKKSIDTGSGLERLVSLKMGVESVFLTDILRSLIAQVENITKIKYDPENLDLAPAFHVIADHIRSLSFAIADGATPSNVDRGYVLRKILRRAVRYGKKLNLNRPFLADVLPRLVETMGEDFPELKLSQKSIGEVLTMEEEAFLRTLRHGENLLNKTVEVAKKENRMISGEEAFKLKDTYGMPLDEIILLAKDENLQIDLTRYSALEEEAKERSKKAQKVQEQTFSSNFFEDFSKTHPKTEFLGYKKDEVSATITAILIGDRFVDTIQEGESGILILDKTPFYAEMGGQVGDKGVISKRNYTFEVQDCSSPYLGVIAHIGVMKSGKLNKGDKVKASIDTKLRRATESNHTATHLLGYALYEVLKTPIKQAGSLVEADRFRFDFNYHKSLTSAELRHIEEVVNEKVREDSSVKDYELPYSEVQNRSDIKQFFGEKYGEKVRVIDIGYSKELCGGTHTSRTGTIGLFKIIKESSISAGTRRIEAVTGRAAERLFQQKEDLINDIASLVKANEQTLAIKIQHLIQTNKELEATIKDLKFKESASLAKSLSTLAKEKGGVKYLVKEVQSDSAASLADNIAELNGGVVALGVKGKDKCQVVLRAGVAAIKKGIFADELIKLILPIIDGSGGGKKEGAQAGGKVQSLNAALDAIAKKIEEMC